MDVLTQLSNEGGGKKALVNMTHLIGMNFCF